MQYIYIYIYCGKINYLTLYFIYILKMKCNLTKRLVCRTINYVSFIVMWTRTREREREKETVLKWRIGKWN